MKLKNIKTNGQFDEKVLSAMNETLKNQVFESINVFDSILHEFINMTKHQLNTENIEYGDVSVEHIEPVWYNYRLTDRCKEKSIVSFEPDNRIVNLSGCRNVLNAVTVHMANLKRQLIASGVHVNDDEIDAAQNYYCKNIKCYSQDAVLGLANSGVQWPVDFKFVEEVVDNESE